MNHKCIALDVGEKRVGVAVGDSAAGVAFPRGILERYPTRQFLERLRKLVSCEEAMLIVVGIPLGEDNEETPRAKEIRRLGYEIASHTGLKVDYIDEFGSTREALSKLPTRAARRKKENHDTLAAQIILQRYFDAPHN